MTVESLENSQVNANSNIDSAEVMTPNMVITPSAQEYLAELLAKQDTPGIAVRIFVEHAGTARAECCMAYSTPEEVNTLDFQQDYTAFQAYIDAPSIPYLKDAVIDYNKDRFGVSLPLKRLILKCHAWVQMPPLKSGLLIFCKLKLILVWQVTVVMCRCLSYLKTKNTD